IVVGVIAGDSDAAAAETCDLRGGVGALDAAAGDVDGVPGLAEAERDAAPDAVARAGDDRDHSADTSDSMPRSTRPIVLLTSEPTMMCCATTCASRRYRCSGLFAYTAPPPPARNIMPHTSTAASTAWFAASLSRARAATSVPLPTCS